jgi:nucleoside-diphosphate-sugar epimerase
MRVFVTGASGWVGSAVVEDLIARGHEAVGLARNDANAAKIEAAGAAVHRGSLEDVESLVAGAKAADAVVHCAFVHDWPNIVASCEKDRRAIEAMGAVVEAAGKPMLITSGTALLSPGKVSTEEIVPVMTPGAFPRIASELAAHELATRGARVSVVRLPPTVHGVGDHGFIAQLVRISREKGKSAYIGEGANRWPAVHRLDAASLYRLALESNLSGQRYHAVAEQGVAFVEIATAIGRGLNLPIVSLSPDEAGAHFGFFGHFAGLDAPSSSAWTSRELDWRPSHPELLADLEGPSYFAT